jgi:hypothetical protein
VKQNLDKKYIHGYKGNFGTTEKRFRSNSSDVMCPGPGQYIRTQEDKENRMELFKVENSNFKSETKREIWGKE